MENSVPTSSTSLDDDGFVVAPDGLGLELDRDALADRRINVD